MEEILVVDDEPMILSMMENVLSMMGYSVTGAGSVEEAIELIARSPGRFDALITDYNLVDGTGSDIMETIKSNDSETPVILMTGSPNVTRSDSVKEGFAGYFHKPFSCVDMGRELDSLLHQKTA